MKKLLKATTLFLVLLWASTTRAQETKNFFLSSTVKWFDTGIDLNQGEKVEISSRGSWSNGGGSPQMVGPTGFAGLLIGSTVAPNLSLAALVARVDNSIFLVGELYNGASPASGRLFLSMNDDDFSDNKGNLKVSVVFTVHEFATGAVVPANFREEVIRQNAIAKIFMDKLRTNPVNKFDGKHLARPKVLPYPPGLVHFDWREQGVSSPVMNQQQCGSCWDFAACSAFEECWKFVTGETINVSEQHVLDCNPRGKGCGGGWPSDAFDLITGIGIAKEADNPYIGRQITPCNDALSKPYKAYAWGYVGDDDGVPSVEELKRALYYNGPLAVCVNVTAAFQKFNFKTGGVFNEGASGKVNHCVTLIGWDDNLQAWLIKNSWTTGWGDQGYGWIAYGSNNIGYGAAWIAPHPVGSFMPDDSTTIYTIKQPIVSRKDVIYDGNNASPRIEFQPGDQVEIEAGGCVQTGGKGLTWKRYVDPTGPNSETFYFGSMHIPGSTANEMTPFRQMSGAQPFPQRPDVWKYSFPILRRFSVQDRFLHLGYTDDNYGDNGYEGHDDGTEDQCKNVGNAYLIIKITRRK